LNYPTQNEIAAENDLLLWQRENQMCEETALMLGETLAERFSKYLSSLLKKKEYNYKNAMCKHPYILVHYQ